MSAENVVVKTITLPTEELLDSLQPLPEGIRAVVWDLVGDPEGVEYSEIDAVVLPYGQWGGFQEALERVPNLKLLQAQSTGYDGLPEMVGPGVGVASAAGVHAAATAEIAVALMLASLRGMDVAIRNQTEEKWDSRRYPGLADRKVLLVGVGGIGAEIAARLKPFDVELTRVGSRARTDDDGEIHGSDELKDLARDAEVLVLITPLTDATRHLVDADVLAAMPDGALVVNVARGAVVDSEALTREVVSGRLHAALDVFDPEPIPAGHPLWSAPNAIISPHVGGNTDAFTPRIRKLLRSQLERLAAGGEPINLAQPGPWAASN